MSLVVENKNNEGVNIRENSVKEKEKKSEEKMRSDCMRITNGLNGGRVE